MVTYNIMDTDAEMLMDMEDIAMADMDFNVKISQSQLKSTTMFSNTAKTLKSRESIILTKESRKLLILLWKLFQNSLQS
jgi:hypothetical protein